MNRDHFREAVELAEEARRYLSQKDGQATAAVYADRVIFLADGRAVDDMVHPTVDGVLDMLRTLGG